MASLTYDEHYAALRTALRQWPDHAGRGSFAVIEARLAIAWRYRGSLPLQKNDPKTTNYWRCEWPRFECEVKYQELRYTLALCPPKGTTAEQRALILEESGRRIRHIESNPGLFAYIQSSRTSRDGQLFGWNPAMAHINSEWLAALWAFDRYDRWLDRRYPRLSPRRILGTSATHRQFLLDDDDESYT